MTQTSILIVEDERIIAKGIEKRLKDMGYAVAGTASTGEEAVEKAARIRPDLVLMDINLGPGMDGVEAAGIIRDQVNKPVVYLTAHADSVTLQRAKLTAPVGYVLKPFEDRDLQTAIEIACYRHAMEQQLLENERWLAATLGSMGDGLIATDEEGRVRFMNVLAEELSGWSQVEAMGKPVSEIFRIVEARTREPVRNPVLDALLTGTNVTLADNTILIGKDGTERPIDDSVAPIRDVAGRIKGAVLVFRDISERRRLEEHLRQAQKMEAIGKLAGGIAHDFNNILTVITGFSELLLDDTQPSARRREAAKNINVAANRAASLTRQILAYSRKQILVPTVLSLNHIVRDMEAMLQRLLGSNIELTVEADLELGPVMADPTQLGQVLLNLATNARDAMSRFGAGQLVIATKNVVLDGEVTRKHPEVYPGKYAMLSVTDTGTGITDDVLAHLFEPFFTTKAVGEGTGLGLATTYGIVKQSGGHIDVSSQLGKGTTFRIYLPIIEGTPAADVDSEQQVRAKGQETVLLVDDDDAVRFLARTVLERDGYLVLEAGSGIEGLEIAAKYPGQIDLLLTDLVMPKVSGHELAKRLKLVRPAVRVLIMSGHDEAAARVDSTVATGEAAFLQKPFRLSDLATKVRELLDRPSTLPQGRAGIVGP